MTDETTSEIQLPGEDYHLSSWSVSDGAVVQSGQTVAFAIQGASNASSSSNNNTINTHHKRPSKRKRPTSDTAEQTVDRKTTPESGNVTEKVPILANRSGILRIDNSSVGRRIGHIEPCTHPTIVDGLCAVCGKQLKDNNTDLMSRVTVSGQTVAVSKTEGQRMAKGDADRLRKQRKLSLVLDLDHTLVHATNDNNARVYLDRPDVRSLILPVIDEEGRTQPFWMPHYVKLRPHMKEFLETAQSLYEISVYTAGTRHYAEQITIVLSRCLLGATRDQMDIENLRLRLSRAEKDLENSARHENGQGPEDQVKNIHEGEETSGEPAQKRKRVTFAEIPGRSDVELATEVRRLRQELHEAEELESQVLELRQRLFGGRVVSRTDVADLGKDVKSLKRIFPCGGTMAVVVDDREDVWANAEDTNSERCGEPPENLLLVRPYHWNEFLGFADVNNAAGIDLSTGSSDDPKEVTENDVQLLWTKDILKWIHERYYSLSEQEMKVKTVPDVVREIRSSVLRGAEIVLSGLVPIHKQHVADITAPRPPIVRFAESLGAKLVSQVSPSVTHVIAARDGTDKTHTARKTPGCFVVRPSWLMECVWSLSRRDECTHLLGSPSFSARPLIESNKSSSEDDEDLQLAVDFENELMQENS